MFSGLFISILILTKILPKNLGLKKRNISKTTNITSTQQLLWLTISSFCCFPEIKSKINFYLNKINFLFGRNFNLKIKHTFFSQHGSIEKKAVFNYPEQFKNQISGIKNIVYYIYQNYILPFLIKQSHFTLSISQNQTSIIHSQ